MKKMLFVIFLLSMSFSLSSAIAADSSPFLSGFWSVGGGESITLQQVEGTEVAITNPTNTPLQTEAIFLDMKGIFCGCALQVISQNAAWEFMTDFGFLNRCETPYGQLKVIGHPPCRPDVLSCRSDVFSTLSDQSGPTLTGSSVMLTPVGPMFTNLNGVTLNFSTKLIMWSMYQQCVKFLKETPDGD